MLVTMDNLGPLPSRSQIRQIRAESVPDRIWEHDNGTYFLSRAMLILGSLQCTLNQNIV